MKVLNNIYMASILFFMTGLVLKLFRTPFHTIIMLVGLGILLVISIVYFITLQRNKGLLGLTTFFSGAYVLSIAKFWPHMVFVAFLIFILILSVVLCRKAIFENMARMSAVALLIIIGLGLVSLPQYQRYYLFNIKYNHHIEADYLAWDKYSWFLNTGGRYKAAVIANNKAYQIVKESNNPEMRSLISRHKRALEENNWKSYR